MKITKTSIIFLLITLVPVFYAYNYFGGSRLNKDQVIEQVMHYAMSDITKRCQKDFGYSDADIAILEKELKRYLILAIVANNDSDGFGMYSKDVDNLWHSFILFTKNYSSFCDKYRGKFIHHNPRTDEMQTVKQRAEARQNLCNFIKMYEEIFEEEIHPVWVLDICENLEPTENIIV